MLSLKWAIASSLRFLRTASLRAPRTPSQVRPWDKAGVVKMPSMSSKVMNSCRETGKKKTRTAMDSPKAASKGRHRRTISLIEAPGEAGLCASMAKT